MKLSLKKEESIELDYDDCPLCHNAFNSTKRKKTKNHAIPKFLNPKTKIIHTLCLECHALLNSYYKHHEISYRKYNKSSSTFEGFNEIYEDLRKDYQDKKLNRGQFGEGLWTNLVSYLRSIQK